MVEGNYLEQHNKTANGNLYYIGYKYKALITVFFVVGNCMTPLIITEKKWGKKLKMFLIDYAKSLYEIVNNG